MNFVDFPGKCGKVVITFGKDENVLLEKLFIFTF